jgi:hypothetical protein
VVSDLMLPKVATTASWDLEKDDVQADPTTLSGKAVTAG